MAPQMKQLDLGGTGRPAASMRAWARCCCSTESVMVRTGAPRRAARYRCDNGEEFDVPFADEAEIPGTWQCRNGLEGSLIEGTAPEAKKVKPPRTHWDMLLERRSVEELEELLKERMDLLKVKRRGA